MRGFAALIPATLAAGGLLLAGVPAGTKSAGAAASPRLQATRDAPSGTGDAAGRRRLERGDRAAADGRHRVARARWLRALATGDDIARQARARLRTLTDQHEYPHWRHAQSQHFRLVAARRSPPGRDPVPFLSRREEVYRDITRTLGTEPSGPITVFVYVSNRQARRLIGRDLGFADPARREIHIRYDQEPGHEEAHVIAWTWNRSGSNVPFVEEGLAVSLSSHPGSPHASAADALAQGRLPSLPDLITRFRSYRDGYILAGSFVRDLIDRHGIEVVRRLYSGGDVEDVLERLEEVTGESIATLQRHWETVLAAQSQTNREDLLAALALLRAGHGEDAIAMLEAQSAAHPDSAVIDFALGQAQRELGDLAASDRAFRRVLDKPLPHRLAWMRQRAQDALVENQERAAHGVLPGD
ncbi:MAG: hypothetical protein ACE5IK_10345 [Acidobacteriota bacterium]